jgi:hypothetical protein
MIRRSQCSEAFAEAFPIAAELIEKCGGGDNENFKTL